MIDMCGLPSATLTRSVVKYSLVTSAHWARVNLRRPVAVFYSVLFTIAERFSVTLKISLYVCRRPQCMVVWSIY